MHWDNGHNLTFQQCIGLKFLFRIFRIKFYRELHASMWNKVFRVIIWSLQEFWYAHHKIIMAFTPLYCTQQMPSTNDSKQKWWKNAIQYTVVYCCKVFFSPVCLRSILNGAYYVYNTFGHIRWRHIGNYDALVEDTSKTTRFAVWKNGFNSSSYKKSNFVQMFTFHTFFRLNSIAVFIGWNKIL